MQELLDELKEELYQSIKDTPADSYLRHALNITYKRKLAFASLNDIIGKKEARILFKETAPFSIASRVDPSKIIMYSNIPRTYNAKVLAEHSLSMWSDGRHRKKIEDAERATTYASKREVTTLGKFLTKYSNLTELGYKDDQIRSLCETVAVENQPPQIITCECPEDYTEMFRVKTGSCMEVGSPYWQSWSRDSLVQIAEDTGLFFACLYHYMPWCKGAYITIAGVPVGRFMLYRKDITQDFWTSYGDLNGSSITYKKVLDTWLAENGGIKREESAVATICDFSVPGITHPLLEEKFGKDLFFCPLPNMDRQKKDFKVSYDKDLNVFNFSHYESTKKGVRIAYTYDWYGYIPSDKVPAT